MVSTETKEERKPCSANQNYECEMNCSLIGSLYKAGSFQQVRSSFHRPPGCADLLLGGGALVSPRRFITQPIIMSYKWVSAGSDMLANTNYAQQERLQLGHILKDLYCISPWRSAPFFALGPVEAHHLALRSGWIWQGTKCAFVCVCVCICDLGFGGFDHSIKASFDWVIAHLSSRDRTQWSKGQPTSSISKWDWEAGIDL